MWSLSASEAADTLVLLTQVRAQLDDCVLLCRFSLPHPAVPMDATVVWAAPGGGVEPGELPLEALRRELHEETGLAIDVDPPHALRSPRRTHRRGGRRRAHQRHALVAATYRPGMRRLPRPTWCPTPMTAKELADQATDIAAKLKPGSWGSVQALALVSIAQSLADLAQDQGRD